MSSADRSRPRRLEVADETWNVCEAWRGESGWGVVYFLESGPAGPAADDRRDRRALLEPATRLAHLEDAELRVLLDSAAGLTSTERRIEDAEGRVWLAQSRGPVWAEDGVAAGLTGLLFTALDGSGERVEASDGHAAALDPAALAKRLREAREADEAEPGA